MEIITAITNTVPVSTRCFKLVIFKRVMAFLYHISQGNPIRAVICNTSYSFSLFLYFSLETFQVNGKQ